jgi:hypothetical protein
MTLADYCTMSDISPKELEQLQYGVISDSVYIPKDAKKEMIKYLDLEIVFRLLWLRAEENLAKAYSLIS